MAQVVATIEKRDVAAFRQISSREQEVVRTIFQEPLAKLRRQLHPSRVRFSILSDRNPFMWPAKVLAPMVRTERRHVSANNPLLLLEKAVSSWIVSSLDAWGAMRDSMSEALFLGFYGLPPVQALAGLTSGENAARHTERDLVRELADQKTRKDLEARYTVGGLLDAVIRALVYIRLPEGSVDERGFSMLMAIRDARPPDERRSLAELKQVLREQFLLVTLDEAKAIDTLPALLPRSPERRRAALELLRRMLSSRGALDDEGRRRQRRVESLFEMKLEKPAAEQQPATA